MNTIHQKQPTFKPCPLCVSKMIHHKMDLCLTCNMRVRGLTKEQLLIRKNELPGINTGSEMRGA